MHVLDEQGIYRWRVHLMRQHPERLPVVLLVLIGAPVLGLWLMGHWLFAVAAFWMMFSATADYLLPIRYEADAVGVRQKGWAPRVMHWERVRRVVWGEQGVLLSPFAQPSRLDAFRGVFLWYGDHPERVRELIERYCPAREQQQKTKRKRHKQLARSDRSDRSDNSDKSDRSDQPNNKNLCASSGRNP